MDGKQQYSTEYKAKIAIETLREANTPGEIASREGINVKQVYNWRKALLEGAKLVFDQSKSEREFERRLIEVAEREEELMAKAGRLAVENDFLKKDLRKLGADERRGLITPRHDGFREADGLSIRRQCEILGVNRPSLYYTHKPDIYSDTLYIEYVMSRIDYWHTMMCYLGAKKLRNKLMTDDGIEKISVERVCALMGEMGICALYPHKHTSIGDDRAVKLP